MHHLRAGFCDPAAREDTVLKAADRVKAHFVSEGELLLGAQVSLITAAGGVCVAEPVIAGDRVRTGDLGLDTLKDLLPRFVFVEAPVGESFQVSAALGRPWAITYLIAPRRGFSAEVS